jgi:protein SCO1/2
MTTLTVRLLGVAAVVLATSPALPTASEQGPVRYEIPNVPVVTDRGERLRFYDDLLKGRVVIVNFIYTRCAGRCPLAMATLARVQELLGDRLGRDIFMLSVSLDPANDTPRVLRRYAETYRARPGWAFLTGRPKDIERLRRSLGFYDRDPVVDADRTKHSTLVAVGNDRVGRWSVAPGLAPPERIRDVVLELAGAPSESAP